MIAILDYGAGNITSVKNLLNLLNVESCITSNIEELNSADKIIFPGVGHAQFAMNQLRQLQLVEFIKNYQKPFLGICLGLQLMCQYSEEGSTECLGIIPAKVSKFPEKGIIPHMGWNNIDLSGDNLIFKDIPSGSDFYFVHSYYVEKNPFCIAQCNYLLDFCAAVQKNNFYGVQFHIEKSSELGKKIMQNFIDL